MRKVFLDKNHLKAQSTEENNTLLFLCYQHETLEFPVMEHSNFL